jgi:hypothetical protein
MRISSSVKGLIAGLGLMVTFVVSSVNLHAQAGKTISDVPSIRSTKDYLEAEQLIDAIAGELYKAYQLYPDFKYDIEYGGTGLLTVTVRGIDNHTIANRIANQIIVLEDMGRAISEIDVNLLPEHPEMTAKDIFNEQQAAAYQPDVDISEGFINVLHAQ